MTTDTFERICAALDKVRYNTDGSAMACCPNHDDKSPSLSLKIDSDGRTLFHCFAGCDQNDLAETLQTLVPDADFRPDNAKQWTPAKKKPSNPPFEKILGVQPSRTWAYHDQAGSIQWYQCRIEKTDGKKTFRPVSWGGEHWISKGPPKPRQLFDVHRILSNISKAVLIVEGEKTVEAAREIFPNLMVTTWPNGAKAVGSVDLRPLRGHQVTIWPGADEPGRNAAAELSKKLISIGCDNIAIVDTKNLPDAWDIADEKPDDVDHHSLLNSVRPIDSSLVGLMLTASQLRKLNIPERKYIVDPFIATDSLSMVFAARGLGKTWFALTLALAIARGGTFLSYHIPKACKVLYIDGEMTLSDLRGRLLLLNGPETEDLILLPSERLFRKAVPLNINNEDHQKLIVKALEQLEREGRRPSLIILDNLSSLGGGVDENDNSALDKQLSWLVSLRHMGYAIMLVHHAGKSGDQRGASRREDLLDTSIKLEPVDKSEAHRYSGAVFDLEFVKTRGPIPKPARMRLELSKMSDGALGWATSHAGKIPAHIQTLMEILKGKVEHKGARNHSRPYKNQKELAEAIGVVKGTVSKHIKILRESEFVFESTQQGLLIKLEGLEALKEHYNTISEYNNSATIFRGEQSNFPI